MKKKKKKTVKEKIYDFFNSYKSIIFTSLLFNIILLITIFFLMSSNKIYTFSGSDDYVKVTDGIIALNTDINLINGNNIEYINNTDYDIKSYKIGYYAIDDNDKLVEIISNKISLDTEIKLSELINNFTSFNVSEKNSSSKYFTHKTKKLIDNGLYLVIEAKTQDGETIFSKVKLNVTKISKY